MGPFGVLPTPFRMVSYSIIVLGPIFDVLGSETRYRRLEGQGFSIGDRISTIQGFSIGDRISRIQDFGFGDGL